MNSRLKPCGTPARNAERGDLRRQARRLATLLFDLQPLQGADHVARTRQLRAARIRTELTPAREPHDDHAGKQAKHDFARRSPVAM